MNLLFDLGNVVLNWNTEQLIQNLPLNEAKKLIIKKELFNNSYWTDLDQGIITEKEVTQQIAEKGELTIADIELCLIAAKNSLIEIDTTIELMEELRIAGINMYCLSNMSVETYSFIKEKPLFKYFNDIVVSGFIKMIKPDSDIFRYTLDKFNILPEETIFVDDSHANTTTAEKFGINCVHFKRTSDCYWKIRAAAGI
jgi:putative hydrolase of the HAD superfamily